MLYQDLAVFATLATISSALPNQKAKRDWINDANGNLHILFSDATLQIGTTPLQKIIDTLTTSCSTTGLCDTDPVDITGYQLVDAGLGSSVYDITVTVNPSGDYPTWIHEGLGEALGAAIAAAAQCADVTNTPTCPSAESYCPAQPFTVNECTVPQFWGVNYQDPNAGTSAPPFMQLTLDVAVDTGSGYCATFATVGGAVAGAVNGVAGGIFSLIGLLCQA